jgi:replicative DNA helicase
MSAPLPDAELPKSLEAETAVLSSILVEPLSLDRVTEFLRPDDFFSQRNQFIFDAMLTLSGDGRPVDLVTLSEALKGKVTPEELGALADGVPDFAHVEEHARIVKDKAILRRLIEIASMAQKEAFGVPPKPKRKGDPPPAPLTPREVLEGVEKRIFELAESGLRTSFVPLKTIVEENLKTLETMGMNRAHITGIASDFTKLDEYTCGFHGGELVYLAGRPGSGKTSFALAMAVNMAKAGRSVGFFSIEMAREQLGMRLVCAEAQIDIQKYRRGYLRKDDYGPLAEAVETLAKIPIYIDDSPALDVLEMRTKCRRLKREKGLDIVFVDYIGLIRPHGRFENRNLELGAISRSLKALAKELSIPVIALSQLSRNPERRRERDAKPQLSDLRESGNLEQDADLVILLHREKEDPAKPEAHKNQAEIIIAKQRNGPTGSFHLAFIKELALFMNRDSDAFVGEGS